MKNKGGSAIRKLPGLTWGVGASRDRVIGSSQGVTVLGDGVVLLSVTPVAGRSRCSVC